MARHMSDTVKSQVPTVPYGSAVQRPCIPPVVSMPHQTYTGSAKPETPTNILPRDHGMPPRTNQASQPRMSLQVIADKLEHLHFKVALFGYSNKDVWHKISRLDEMYRELYEMQEFRYQSLLRERDELLRRSCNGNTRM